MALNRSQLTDPPILRETVDVPELKNRLVPGATSTEVIVQMLMMDDRLEIAAMEMPKFRLIAEVLALSVVDDEGAPVWTSQKWRAWGSQNQDAAWKLFEVAQRLSKLGGPEEKNETAPS